MKPRCKIAKTKVGTYLFITPTQFEKTVDRPANLTDLSEKDLLNLLIDSKDLYAREAVKYFIRRKKKCSISDICIKAGELSEFKK